ncbi:efflux transporter outer membrane subunit [Dyella ginsengisoli]|uniref:Efflux transporter outer membrane subunit n=1 Tax=Dyella ginsengisoli TaxID=363848 RepID=A0ABW8JUU5_9GAMM
MKPFGSSLSWRVAQAALFATPALLLSACMVGPDFSRPAAPASRHYDLQAERALTAPGVPGSAQRIDADRAPTDDWWTVLGSPKLDQLMRQAVAGNLDLDAADATIAQANEAVAAAGGALLPQLDIAAQGGRQRTGHGTTTQYAVGPQVSFDFDLFGDNRRRIEEQTALAELQRHRFDAAYLTVTGDVARQAILLASARAQMGALDELLADDRRNLELVRSAERYGSATQVDVALALNQLAQDQTLLPPLAQQRDTARHALSVLAGKGPADWMPPDFALSDFALPAELPLTLPSELARRRPDILEAEAELHATSAAIGVATADLYPHLQLSASVSRAGPGAGTLWGVAGALTAPLFHGGTLKANRRGAVDAYQASFAVYRQTVIRSLGQVADLLQAINHDNEEYAAQQRALNAAETGLRISQAGFQAGETGLLQVLDAQRAYQRALIGQLRAKTAQYLDTAQLSVALGGHSDGALARRMAHDNE